jgi:hypothetical protein
VEECVRRSRHRDLSRAWSADILNAEGIMSSMYATVFASDWRNSLPYGGSVRRAVAGDAMTVGGLWMFAYGR